MEPVKIDNGGYRKFKWTGWNDKDGNPVFHLGTDYNCPKGTPIYAITNGKVLTVRSDVPGFGGYIPTKSGGVIIIEHKNKNGHKFLALYGHVVANDCFIGRYVKKGEIIGYVHSYFHRKENLSHLHFCINIEITKPLPTPWGYSADVGLYVDPKKYIEQML